MSQINVGEVSELLVQNFFDKYFSNVYSFRSPKTSSNAEVADVLVWLNRVAFLIEVKGRDTGKASIESWAKLRVTQGATQIVKNYNRFKAHEQVNLHNNYYNFQFLHDDTVHFMSKYLRARQEYNMNPPAAVQYSFHTVGTAMWVTTLALVAGFLVLSLSGYRMNSDMGLMTATTISLALALAPEKG